MPSTSNSFNNLSIKDLIEARDLFHVHLINKKNVVATAVGRYLIRKTDIDKNGNYSPDPNKKERTLDNSIIIDISWPCILVFVKKWEKEMDLIHNDSSDIVPKNIYMPDGRIVPICVVVAPKNIATDDTINKSDLRFPTNLIGGGFPVIINSQGTEHIASIACVVTDGHKYYALTNKHVSGDSGQTVESYFGYQRTRIGISSGKTLGKLKFSSLYSGWANQNILVSCDAGLIEIDNINVWKTDILGIKHIDELFDLNTANLNLNLIAEHKVKDGVIQDSENGLVTGYGAVSGLLKGEINALFYRYQSIGGIEYVSDFLIGGRKGKKLNVHHGDSGTLWLLETLDEDKKKMNQPIALHWGQHEFFDGKNKNKYTYSLSTCLSNICRGLDIEIVRGWNIDNEYSWGKTGHYKIAAKACEIVSNPKLKKLLQANLDLISYDDDSMNNNEMKNAAWGKFVPLADVPDIIWRMNRKADEANHFADMDEKNEEVFANKDLLELCHDANNVDIDFWNEYYTKMENLDSKRSPDKRGALPFRVWQAYKLMVQLLKEKKLAEFIFVGGTASHYLGDACQPLHVSYLHHGNPDKPEESPVHSTYETTMLDRYRKELFDELNNYYNTHIPNYQTYSGGKSAAISTIKMMEKVVTQLLPPEEIISIFNETDGRGRVSNMWKKLKDKTVQCMAEGCENLALFWESAWAEADGNSLFQDADLVGIDPKILIDLYMDPKNYTSYKLRDPLYKTELL